jgi:hypothetical protein
MKSKRKEVKDNSDGSLDLRIDPSLSASLFLIDRKLSGTKMPNPTGNDAVGGCDEALNLAQRVRKWRENYDG